MPWLLTLKVLGLTKPSMLYGIDISSVWRGYLIACLREGRLAAAFPTREEHRGIFAIEHAASVEVRRVLSAGPQTIDCCTSRMVINVE